MIASCKQKRMENRGDKRATMIAAMKQGAALTVVAMTGVAAVMMMGVTMTSEAHPM